MTNDPSLKGLVHPKMKITLWFTHPQAIYIVNRVGQLAEARDYVYKVLNMILFLGWWYTGNFLSNFAGQLYLSNVAWVLFHWERVTNFYLDTLDRLWALCLTW